jgi:polyhydroxyalkanoate synthesis regulator phasin
MKKCTTLIVFLVLGSLSLKLSGQGVANPAQSTADANPILGTKAEPLKLTAESKLVLKDYMFQIRTLQAMALQSEVQANKQIESIKADLAAAQKSQAQQIQNKTEELQQKAKELAPKGFEVDLESPDFALVPKSQPTALPEAKSKTEK